MGFCLFNNAAVGAAHAIASCGAERVLILDWDVHHGNGTAEIFERRDDVLYVSIHQSPLYPGTGAAAETGSGRGVDMTLNLPVPPGAGGPEFTGLVEHVACPVARSWRPDLLLISAGYDAHAGDPLANCALGDDDYGTMSALIRDLGREIGAPVARLSRGWLRPGGAGGLGRRDGPRPRGRDADGGHGAGAVRCGGSRARRSARALALGVLSRRDPQAVSPARSASARIAFV